MPARISDAPWAVPFKSLVLKLRLCKPEYEIIFILLVYILLDIISHSNLKLFLLYC